MSLSYSQKDLEKRNRIIALVITVAINSILFFLIWQVKIWKESPTAIIQRLEESKTGEITFEPEPPAPEPEVQEEITENTETEQPNTVPPLTSTVESPVTVKSNTTDKAKEEKVEEPVVDLNLTMGKRTKKGNAGGTGSGNDSDGKSGTGKGTPGGTGSGEGKIAQDWTFDLNVIKSIENVTETGEITFFIRINEKGNVTEIRIDRTNIKLSLAERYKKAIKNSRFYPKSDGIRAGGASGYRTIKIVPTN